MNNNLKYVWCITKEFPENVPSNHSILHVVGPRGNDWCISGIGSHKDAQKFRLVDDDDEVYCEGYFVDLVGTCSGFEPLDDFGLPSLGCTEIQYWNIKESRWEPL